MSPIFNKNQQSGIALVISLIMLLLLTLIGVTSMQVTGLEEKMAGNSKDQNVAFQAAEISLRDSEAWITSQVTEPEATATGSNGVWILNSMDPTANAISWWQEAVRDQAWWQANAIPYGTVADIAVVSTTGTTPYSLIEQKQFVPDTLKAGEKLGRTYYQITARGTGGSDLSKVLLQSTVTKRY